MRGLARPSSTSVTAVKARTLRRRIVAALLVAATVATLGVWLASILSAGGLGLLDALMLVAFLIHAPWLAVAFWNACIGFVLLNITRDPLARVLPQAARARHGGPLASRNAILMTVRNEDPSGAVARLTAMLRSLDQTRHGSHFDFFMLSDSTDPGVIAAEKQAIERLNAELAVADRVSYRRRADNAGFKSGNVRDFCERWGSRYDFMVLLDIDSLMTGETVVRMVRIMEANPHFGILQSIGVGEPTSSLFARVVQFGHRNLMRVMVVGTSWWQADCGCFWGHNAVVRIEPFTRYCHLPVLPGDPPFGGTIISHDQIEAALMRRAGFEVRLLPQECGSYEGTPPALPDFLRRSHRWCQGNLQNLRLIGMPGLAPMSRLQLLYIAEQNIGAAAIISFAMLAAIAAGTWPAEVAFPAHSALGLYLTWLAMFFTPRLLGIADALIRERRSHGGSVRLVASGFIECGFAALLLPIWYAIMAVSMVLLMLGRSMSWTVQQRESHVVHWRHAVVALWPASLLGLALFVLLAITEPRAIVWFLPFLTGLVLAVPFASLTTRPGLGEWAERHKICPAPEEIDCPWELAAILHQVPT
jgi:membrane glycosyltransferase